MVVLTKSSSRALSTISANFSAVFLGSLVLPVFVGDFAVSNWPVILLGLVGVLSSVLLSIKFAQRGRL